jgi:hypothetical protein
VIFRFAISRRNSSCQIVRLLHGIPLNRWYAPKRNDLVADQPSVAVRLFGVIEEHAGIHFAPEAGHDKAGLCVLGNARPFMAQDIVQFVHQMGIHHISFS